LLHGFLSGRAAWGPLRRELGGSVTTIAPDLPGYGASSFAGGDYTLERVVERLVPLVERAQPTHVVGHSMGGIVALALAGALPGRFESVGVVGLPVFHGRADGVDCLRQRGPAVRAFLLRDRVAHVACRLLHPLRDAWLPVASLAVPRRPVRILAATFDHDRDSHVGGLDQIVFAGLVEDLALTVGTPVAALHGGADETAPPARVRQLSTARGWDFRLAPTASHQLIFERPRLVARWLRERVLQVPAK